MFLEAIAIGGRALAANPLRTALSTLGVIMGTGALVAVLSVGDGVEAFARQQLEQTTDLQLLSIDARTDRFVDGVSLPVADTIRFTPQDAVALAAALSAGASVTLRRLGAAGVTGLPNGGETAARVVTQDAGAPPGQRDDLESGRWFTPADVQGDSAVAIVSQAFAARVTGSTDHRGAIGHTVQLQGTPMTIVGVTRAPASNELIAWVPPDRFVRSVLPAMAGALPTIVVRADRVERMPALAAGAQQWIRSRWPAASDRIAVRSNVERVAQARQAMLIFKLLMGAITGISLLVGGIGIMNVLLASVTERTREIGVRLAVGARRRDILTQFLAEAVTITGAGSAIGVVLGIGVATGTTAVMRARTSAPVAATITASTLAIAALSAIVVGLIFGLYPARRAAALAPIDAIRHE